MEDSLKKILTLQDPDIAMGGVEEEMLVFLQTHHSQGRWRTHQFKELERENEEAPELELKPLPSNLKYACILLFLYR